jgi:diguanylate cyclase (GGDEF)-like protein/PAS domain S-box-containing protein
MDYTNFMWLDVPVASALVCVEDGWNIEQVNDDFVKMFGYKEKEIKGGAKKKFILEQDIAVFEEAMRSVTKENSTANCEVRVRKADRSTCWVEVRASLYQVEGAKHTLLLLFLDIDSRKTGELEQKLLNQKYEMMENMSREFPFDLNVENWTMLRSYRIMELRGDFEAQDAYYPVNEEVSRICPPDQKLFLETMQDASQNEKTGNIDTRLDVSRDGESPKYMWFRTYYKSVAGTDGRIVRIIGRSFNIDTDKSLQDEVRRDPLTKILSKLEVRREVDNFLNSNKDSTHVVLLIDIDDFKSVNDNFGHVFGDTVIMDVANIIKTQFRMNDVIGRVGGDEFFVLMKRTTIEKALEKAETLCSLLSRDYSGGDVSCHISTSIGIALYPENGEDYDALYEKADHAVLRAKKKGKNRCEIAKTSDVGPVLRESRKIDHHDRIGAEDREFLSLAVNLMAHAKNLDGSLNQLLKQIAERYQLDFVAIVENSLLDTATIMTNYYTADGEFYDKMLFSEMHPIVENLAPGEYTILTQQQFLNIEKLEGGQKKHENMILKDPFSAVIGKFEYVGGHTGEIYYVRTEEEPNWQPGELEVFQELTHTMAIFVSLRYRMDESQEQIRYIQNRDPLTKLYNQEAFRIKARDILMQADPTKIYAIEYLDINNFGYINENYGYKAGDNILRLFAEDILEQDTFCAGCRLYSDFFLILATGDDKDNLLDNIRAERKRFFNIQNHQYRNSGLGLTAGIYIIENNQMDLETAIENATLAWKNAKNTGRRDIVLYDPAYRNRRAEEQRVIGEFFEALYRDDFQMYLQPKFKLGGEREVYGAEALARWRRPDGEILTPYYFIDALEKIGYITELDFYIYEQVLKTLDRWKKQGRRNIIISTNFSGHHFDGDGEEFLSRIEHILSKYEIDPGSVEIEVTESVMVQSLEVLRHCMDRLHEMGFRVAVDDFGTGYSSLSIMGDIPADVIKIDKSFLDNHMSDQKLSLLYEIGRMVKIMKKDIIVEGVETEEQEKVLLEGGFNCAQGFLCNKPIPVRQFEDLYL